MEEKYKALQAKLKEVKNINDSAAVLGWDQQVYMPSGGAIARAEQLATLGKLAHEIFTTDEIGQLLTELLEAENPYASEVASTVRVAKRDYDKACKLPPELVEEMSRTFSLGQQVWTRARAEQDFAQFQEILERIVDLNIQAAEAYGYEETIYDALLDLYEPGMKTAEVTRVFAELKSDLVPLVKAIAEHKDAVDDSFLRQNYPVQSQWEFGMIPLQAIGYDLQRGRQDQSAHPFTTSFSVNDVRITTRVNEKTFPSALFGTLHEGGHALYEQNVSEALEGTVLAGGTSLGVHESQSRLWENVLGRSKAFWQFYYPQLQDVFPLQLKDVSLDSFYRAINKVEPGLIRVEADEVTYNLHIFLRFELEQELLAKRLKVSDLPEAWNAKMQDYLGLTPANDAVGVLQDIHWSTGSFGYFPTYTLGNILSLQFYKQTRQDIPDLSDQFVRGEFGTLLAWFKDKVHQYGRIFMAKELLERVTGSRHIEAGPYMSYIREKYAEIYDL
ncbi:MAG: carboxypeptidase M32 [Anaerolineae bacterium]|nr:carboxypeptidase M32 [Anaerolineae bacterium]